jgi:hypothetical protein
MAHSLFLMVPISAQGVVVDPGTGPLVQSAMAPPFEFTDVFMYSHGWWTRADAAMVDYNRFLIGMSPVVLAVAAAPGAGAQVSFGLGLHWPSMVSEDSDSPLAAIQPFTYFNRSKMADAVGSNGGYSLLRLILEARRAGARTFPRLHLIGHSFGCKVVCAALQQLAQTFAGTGLLADLPIRLTLIQGAFDFDALEARKAYAHVLDAYPKLRLLVTRSELDFAVGREYVVVQRVMNLFHGASATPGLGFAGPSDGTVARARTAGGVTSLAVGPGFIPPDRGLDARLVVADLTPLHRANPDPAFSKDGLSGHHSDIFHPEIYRLLVAFGFTP